MAETYSEKLFKDSLQYQQHHNQIAYWQKVTTPKYQKEPLDFLVVPNDGITRLIEVKESGGNLIPQGNFNPYQREVLSHPLLNEHTDQLFTDRNTEAWILLRFYDKDRKRNHSAYFDYFFFVPGSYCLEKTISLNMCLNATDIEFIAEYRGCQWQFGVADEHGLTTRGNHTEGFTDFKIF